MASKEYFKKKIDPYKPKIWENKNYIIPDEENFDKINKLYSDFFTLGYDDILIQFNRENILNYRTEEGKTLIIAVLENQELNELQKKNIIEKLIHLKVSVNAKDKYNKTSLHIACEKGYNSIIQLLIEKKVLKNELDNYGNAPIHYYVERFIKDCNDYDVYKKNPNTINPQKKKYSEIIDNLLTLQILDFIKKNAKINNNIFELIKLIKFFDIKNINEEYNNFVEETKFKLEDLTYPEKKNRMFKRYIQLKNNIYKLFEEKNKIEYIDDENIDTIITEKKNSLVLEIKDNNIKILNKFEDIKKNIEIISNSLSFITETLFLLIYIENSYEYTLNMNINYINIEISKGCKNILNNIKTVIEEASDTITLFSRQLNDINEINKEINIVNDYEDIENKNINLIKKCAKLLDNPNIELLPEINIEAINLMDMLIKYDQKINNNKYKKIYDDLKKILVEDKKSNESIINYINKIIEILITSAELLHKEKVKNYYVQTEDFITDNNTLIDRGLEVIESSYIKYLKEMFKKIGPAYKINIGICALSAVNYVMLYLDYIYYSEATEQKPGAIAYDYMKNEKHIFLADKIRNNNDMYYIYKFSLDSITNLLDSTYSYSQILSLSYLNIDDFYIKREKAYNEAEVNFDNEDKIFAYYNDIVRAYDLAIIGHNAILEIDIKKENAFDIEWKRTLCIINKLFLNMDCEDLYERTKDMVLGFKDKNEVDKSFNALNKLNFDDKGKVIFQATVLCFIFIYDNWRKTFFGDYKREHITPASIMAAYIANKMWDFYPNFKEYEKNITTTIYNFFRGYEAYVSSAVYIGVELAMYCCNYGLREDSLLVNYNKEINKNITLSTLISLPSFDLEAIDKSLSWTTWLKKNLYTGIKPNSIREIAAKRLDINDNDKFIKKLIGLNDKIIDIYQKITTNNKNIMKERATIINSVQEALNIILPQYNAIKYDLSEDNRQHKNFIKAVILSASGYNENEIEKNIENYNNFGLIENTDDFKIKKLIDIITDNYNDSNYIITRQIILNIENTTNIDKLFSLEFVLKKIKDENIKKLTFNTPDNQIELRKVIVKIINIIKQLSFFDYIIKDIKINDKDSDKIKSSIKNDFKSILYSFLTRIYAGRKTNKFKFLLNDDRIDDSEKIYEESGLISPRTPAMIVLNEINDEAFFTLLNELEDVNSTNIQTLFNFIAFIYNKFLKAPSEINEWRKYNDVYSARATIGYIIADSYDNFYYPIQENYDIKLIEDKYNEKINENKTLIKLKKNIRDELQKFNKIKLKYDENEENIKNKDFLIIQLKSKKEEIFKLFNIKIPDLIYNSYYDNNNSFLFYDHINTYNQKLINNDELNQQNFEEKKKEILTTKSYKYLLNNIKSKKFIKIGDGTIIIDIENEDIIIENENTEKIKNENFEPISFYDNSEYMFNYKYFNVHFIIELINKYIEDIQNLNLPSLELEDEDFFNKVSVNTIIKIYNNYEKIICIINNFNVINRKTNNINEDVENLSIFLEELKISNILNYNEYKFDKSQRKKKYKIEQKGGENNLNSIYKNKIEEISKLINTITPNILEQLYENFKLILDYYNNIIERIDKIYSLRYFLKNENINLYTNRFMLLNIEILPKNLKLYFYNFFDNNKIKYKNIEKILLKFNDYNFNIIYGEQIEYDFKCYYINKTYYLDAKNDDYIYTDDNLIITNKSEIFDIFKKQNTDGNEYIIYNKSNIDKKDKFTTGYFINNDCYKGIDYLTNLNAEDNLENEENKDLIYLNAYKEQIAKEKYGHLLIKDEKYAKNEIIILAIYYYELFLNKYIKEVKESLKEESKKIFSSVKCNFSEKYSSENKDTKKIIKNLDKIIGNEEEMKELLELKINNIIKLILDHQSSIETNKIIRILFNESEQFSEIKNLVEKTEEEEKDNLSYKVKDLLDVRPYIIDNFKDIDDRNFSVKIINNTCLNTTCLKTIKNFKFNLRLPDKNGNTVIHRLIDQLNEEGIDKLLDPKNGDTAIVTYKNKNDQTPIEYLLENLKITIKKYEKKIIEDKIEEIALKINEDFVKIYENSDNIIGETKLKWTIKDTKTIFSYSLNQFNEYLWLKLYEFKNNISNEDIDNLKKILESRRYIKEDLLIKSIDINIIKTKLEKMFLRTDNKNNLENNFKNKICDELSNLYNAKNNLLKIQNNKLFDNEEIQKEINEINEEISIKENQKVDINNFIKVFNKNQEERVSDIIRILQADKSNLIKKFNLNMEEFTKLSKKLDNDYLKLLHLLYDIKSEETNSYISDFNYELICTDINELEKEQKKAYRKYFENHLNTIFMDFNDLEKYEDYSINYVNYQILEIIYVNMVHTISWEIYNGLLKYLLEKYDLETKKEKRDLDTKLILKNIKILLKNKIFDILLIKNPDKVYETSEFYKDIIINTLIDFTNKKLEDEDKKNMEEIIEFYVRILENIVNLFYNDIKENLIDQRKIVLLLKIYYKLKYYEKIINNKN